MERVTVRLSKEILKANLALEVLMNTEGFTSNPEYLSAVEELGFSLSAAINTTARIEKIKEQAVKDVAAEHGAINAE